jgi:hypothetical protein
MWNTICKGCELDGMGNDFYKGDCGFILYWWVCYLFCYVGLVVVGTLWRFDGETLGE